jgi:hypothetical protein
MVDPDVAVFDCWLDACHTAMINATPRARGKSEELLRPEAKALADIRLRFFDAFRCRPTRSSPCHRLSRNSSFLKWKRRNKLIQLDMFLDIFRLIIF